MRALLDTHVFLWAIGPEELLSQAARDFLSSGENELVLSVVSLWEIQLKAEKGMLLTRFESGAVRVQFLRDEIEHLAITILPLAPAHVFALANLPMLHRDPFDRILVAQATVEKIPLVTGDRAILQYPIQTLW
jgi:PIN domain nuclease of toxin-antitoxin system